MLLIANDQVIDIDLRSSHIGLDLQNAEQEGDEFIIPIKNEKLNKNIEQLAYEIASRNEWCYPDLDNIETKFIIEKKEKTCVYLNVTVIPPKFTEDDIDGLLITYDMVNASKDFYNNVGLQDNMDTFKLDIDDNEMKRLFNIKT